MQVLFVLFVSLFPSQFTVEVVEPTPTPVVTPRFVVVVEQVQPRFVVEQVEPSTPPATSSMSVKPTTKPTIPSAGIVPRVNTNSRRQCVGGNCGTSGTYQYRHKRRGRRR